MAIDTFRLRVHGAEGRIVLGGLSTAAQLGAWSIRNVRGTWQLSATATRVDRFLVRQRGLGFTAPRPRGFWFWPVVSIDLLTDHAIRATLKSPEQ